MASAVACSASVKIPGPMPRSINNLNLENIEQSQTGTLTKSYLDFNYLPMTFSVNTSKGPHKFSFGFSENITDVRILLGGVPIYEGKPVKSLEAEAKSSTRLSVKFQWEGRDAQVTISGC